MQEMQETQVQSLGQEDPLEEGMAPIPVFFPWTEEPGGLQSMKELDTTEAAYQDALVLSILSAPSTES